MKKILVTGGAGFIGSHLCKQLIEDGNKVICIDDFSSGSINNLSVLLKHPNFILRKRDVRKLNQYTNLEVDEIYNLACPASPVFYQKDPVKTIDTCMLGMINVLELARKLDIKVLQASTSEVYGDPIQHPQMETYWGNVNPVGIRSCYDEGKRCAETLCMDYHRQYNVDVKIARIFNTYGPHMRPDDGRVVSNFIVQALKGENITIYGSGNQTRSFQYVDDLIRGFLLLIQHEGTGPVNIGNPNEFTINNLARKIIELTDSRSKLIHYPLPSDDPTQRKPDITMAKTYLGWEPHTDLTRGLTLTISYFRNLLKNKENYEHISGTKKNDCCKQQRLSKGCRNYGASNIIA